MVMSGTMLGAKVAMDVAVGVVETVLFGKADSRVWRRKVGFVLAIRIP